MVYFIVPVYNVEKYLKKCLDSILKQTGTDFQIVCVNDGSTDGSLDILNEYKKKYLNIQIINKENGGLSSARNAALDAISYSNENFIVFVDSDDYLNCHFLSTSLDLQSKYNADLVCTKYKSFNDGSEPILNDYVIEEIVYDKTEALKELLADNIKCHSPCKFYKSSLWKNIRFDENISFLEDQYLTPQIFNQCDKIVVSNYIGYFYLHRPTSLCGSRKTNKKIIDAINAYIFLYKYPFTVSDKELADVKKIVLDQFFDTYLMLLPRFDFKNASNNELEQITKIKEFRKQTKAQKFFKINSSKRLFKKMLFLIFRNNYCKIYRIFEKN